MFAGDKEFLTVCHGEDEVKVCRIAYEDMHLEEEG